MTVRATEAPAVPSTSPYIAAGAVLLVTTAGALVTYKASAALKVLAKAQSTGALSAKAGWIDPTLYTPGLRPFVSSLNYLSWVAIALTFGIVLGAMVRAFIPSSWLERTVMRGGAAGYALAAIVGAPLMLCSCCVAPVFEGAYARTRRLGPALGLMLAAPALNPAALGVTFVIFSSSVSWARLVTALALVLGGAATVGRVVTATRAPESCPIDNGAPSWSKFVTGFGDSLRQSVTRSIPAILVGVIGSAAIAGLVPPHVLATLSHGASAYIAIVVVALIAVPLAMPTFGEIPLALTLSAAGAPTGAVVAILIAGPSINLPSLLTLARTASAKVALATAATVFALATVSGCLLQVVTP